MKRGLEDELTKVKTLEVVEREDLEKPEKSEDTSEQDSQTEGLFSDEL